MVERSLSMREAPGSIPGLSNFAPSRVSLSCRDDPGWLWGWTSNPLVVDAAEVRFLLLGDTFFVVLFGNLRRFLFEFPSLCPQLGDTSDAHKKKAHTAACRMMRQPATETKTPFA